MKLQSFFLLILLSFTGIAENFELNNFELSKNQLVLKSTFKELHLNLKTGTLKVAEATEPGSLILKHRDYLFEIKESFADETDGDTTTSTLVTNFIVTKKGQPVFKDEITPGVHEIKLSKNKAQINLIGPYCYAYDIKKKKLSQFAEGEDQYVTLPKDQVLFYDSFRFKLIDFKARRVLASEIDARTPSIIEYNGKPLIYYRDSQKLRELNIPELTLGRVIHTFKERTTRLSWLYDNRYEALGDQDRLIEINKNRVKPVLSLREPEKDTYRTIFRKTIVHS